MRHQNIDLEGEDRELVRAGDSPGMLMGLRTLARAMLSLTDATDMQRSASPSVAGDRRRWGKLAGAIHRERSRRGIYFPAELFGEPAWDILLDLAHAFHANELRSIKSVCLSAHVPEATALRYIDLLVKHDLVERKPDRTDKRRKYLTLTALGERQMRDFLDAMPPMGDHGEDVIRQLILEADAKRSA